MPNFEIGHTVNFELDPKPSKALRKFGEGRIKISLAGMPIWFFEKQGECFGVEWTWNELLSFFVSNWTWLFNEQDLPIAIRNTPSILAGRLRDVSIHIAQKNNLTLSSEQKRELRMFYLRHDMALASSGIQLPSLVLLRMGNQFLFSAEKTQILVSIEDTYRLLSDVGNEIYNWMLPYADNSTLPLLEQWRERDSRVQNDINENKYLLTRMSQDDFERLSDSVNNDWNNEWHGIVMRESETFAAARMTSGFVDLHQQIDIQRLIRATPSHDVVQIDMLSASLQNTLPERFVVDTSAHNQGYEIAEQLRYCLQCDVSVQLDPDELLAEWGVHVEEVTWADSLIDALSCWGRLHGPLIVLNVAPEKRCSHINGRRFTLAHEICHLLVDRGLTMPVAEVLGNGMPAFFEKRANAFAAEFIFPRTLAALEFRNNTGEINLLITQLQNTYHVPYKTVASQIYNSSARADIDRIPSESNFFQQLLFGERGEEDNA